MIHVHEVAHKRSKMTHSRLTVGSILQEPFNLPRYDLLGNQLEHVSGWAVGNYLGVRPL